MDYFGVSLMIVATVGVVMLILLFERRRARQIEHDLRSPDDAPERELRSHDDIEPPARGRDGRPTD